MIKTTLRSNLAMAVLAVAMGAASAQAEEAAAEAAPEAAAEEEGGLYDWDLGQTIFGPDSAYDVGGWLAASYNSDNTGYFNNDQGFNLTQAWLYVAKTLDASEGFDWGFRIDGMFGSDGPDTQAFGSDPGKWDFDKSATYNGKYGFAVPQLFVELGYKDITVKAGHFYTPVGYEVVTAPDNFFYSHAFTMNFSEPFTHTGVIATYSGIENVSMFAGWTAGWDTGFDQTNGGSNAIFGATVTPTEWLTLAYVGLGGDMGWIGDGYNQSVVATVKVTDDLTYVAQSDWVDLEQTYDAGLGYNPDYESIGINQYLLYTVTERFALGARGEWYRNGSDDYYSFTTGANVKILEDLKIRPEFRYQFSSEADGTDFLSTAGVPFDQAAVALDVVLTF